MPIRRRHSAHRTPKSALARPRRPLFETLENRSLLATTPVQVLLMIGQSNMGGYPSTAELTPPLDAPQSDVWIWQDDLVQNVGWTSLRGGFGGDSSNFSSGGDGAQFGPEVALGRTLADASPESQYAIIKHVQGGTMQDGWNPDRGGGAGPGQNWNDFVNKTNEALDELSASQLDYEIAGLFVFQGSRDAGNETGVEAANYEQNFTDFISGVRQEFAAPQMPVVLTKLPEYRVVGSGASGYGNTLLVRNGQEAVDAAVPLTTMIEANDFSRGGDGTHFDAEGQIGLGQRFADAFLGVPFEGSARVGSDGFESGSLTSGFEQWASGAWTASGDASVTTAGAPFDNAYHVRLTSSTGDLSRAVDSTGLTNEKLRFWSKLESFESGDKASVKVSADGTNWITVREFVDGEDDNVYRYHEIDLPDIGNTIYVRFDAEMSESTDYWYLDDVIIEGTTPAGSDAEFSISDASANEGSNTLKLLDRFVPAGSGGLSRPRGLIFGPDANFDGAQDLYVTDINLNAILRYDGITGAFLDTFVTAASGGLNNPGDVAFGPDGNLYVSSYLGNQVLRYDGGSGAFLDVVASGLSNPLGLTFGADGSLYIANKSSHEVLRYNNGVLSAFVSAGSGDLSLPVQGVFGPDGNFYVASSGTGRILRYSGLTGTFLNTFATTGSTEGPTWLEFGTDGHLYTTARTSSIGLDTSIIRFNATTGTFVDTLPIGRDSWSFIIGPSNIIYYSGNGGANYIERYGASSLAAVSITLSSASALPVIVNYATANSSATAGSDFNATSGTLTFAPGQTSRTILVQTLDDAAYEGNETFTVNLSNPVGGVIVDGQGVGTIVDNDPPPPPPTKFYVVNDASTNRTYEYGPTGSAVENYALNSANSTPRGAASNLAGDKVWVVDSNRKVYVYDPSGTLLGSWTAGTLASNADVQGITTNGTDVWIVDAKSDKVFKYTGAASRLTGSQGAASSFNLNGSNTSPTDLVTDGSSIWVTNNSLLTDKVFKYTVSGSLQGSWTISGGGGSPTGITIDPSGSSDMWIVDSTSDKVYLLSGARNAANNSSVAATQLFALASGNTNPQGIADPPVPTIARSASEGYASATAGSPSSASYDTALLSVLGELESLLGKGVHKKRD